MVGNISKALTQSNEVTHKHKHASTDEPAHSPTHTHGNGELITPSLQSVVLRANDPQLWYLYGALCMR